MAMPGLPRARCCVRPLPWRRAVASGAPGVQAAGTPVRGEWPRRASGKLKRGRKCTQCTLFRSFPLLRENCTQCKVMGSWTVGSGRRSPVWCVMAAFASRGACCREMEFRRGVNLVIRCIRYRVVQDSRWRDVAFSAAAGAGASMRDRWRGTGDSLNRGAVILGLIPVCRVNDEPCTDRRIDDGSPSQIGRHPRRHPAGSPA